MSASVPRIDQRPICHAVSSGWSEHGPASSDVVYKKMWDAALSGVGTSAVASACRANLREPQIPRLRSG
jgi:hypothetical protein